MLKLHRIVRSIFALMFAAALVPLAAGASAAPRVTAVEPAPAEIVITAGGAGRVVVRFSEPVNAPPGSVKVLSAAGIDPSVTTDFDLGPDQLRITLSPAPQADIVTIVIDQTATGLDDRALDGEIASPLSPAFPSGDGVEGGPAVLVYQVLLGDVTGDRDVNARDLARILGSWGQDHPMHDLNADGVVDTGDLSLLLTNWGLTLPDLPTAPVVASAISPAGLITADVAEVSVEFSAPIHPASLFPGALHAVSLAGGFQAPASATLVAGGLGA